MARSLRTRIRQLHTRMSCLGGLRTLILRSRHADAGGTNDSRTGTGAHARCSTLGHSATPYGFLLSFRTSAREERVHVYREEGRGGFPRGRKRVQLPTCCSDTTRPEVPYRSWGHATACRKIETSLPHPGRRVPFLRKGYKWGYAGSIGPKLPHQGTRPRINRQYSEI